MGKRASPSDPMRKCPPFPALLLPLLKNRRLFPLVEEAGAFAAEGDADADADAAADGEPICEASVGEASAGEASVGEASVGEARDGGCGIVCVGDSSGD